MEQLKVGYLPLVKGSWVNGKQEIRRAEVIGMFSKLDAEIVEEGRIIVTEEEANSSIEKFEKERVDAVIVHFLSVALGAVVPAAARRLGVPVIFWSEPEPPWDGGRIQKNSFCGTNCNAHALWKMRLPYTFVYGEGPEAVEAIGRKLRVVAAVKGLRNLRIGSVGGRVPGFYASNYDELQLLDTFGISTEKLTMLEVVEKARKIFADSAEPCAPVADPIRSFDITDEERRRLKALFQAFVETAKKYRLDAFAIRCWPEFSDIYGIGVCALIGLLNEAGFVTGCEGDMIGTVTMKLGSLLVPGEKPFFCDLISFDEQANTGVVWHCGAAAPSLCRGGCEPRFCKHSIIDGGGVKGVSCEFPLKPGRVTLMRIGEDRDGGYRLFMAAGTALETEQLLRGTPLQIKFDEKVSDLIETIIDEGVEHHYALIHGDVTAELKLFAKWMGIQII